MPMYKRHDRYRRGGPWRKVRARLGGDDEEYLDAWTDDTMVAFAEEEMREICDRINNTPFGPTCGLVANNRDLLGERSEYIGQHPMTSYVLRWDWYTGDNVPARVAPMRQIDGQSAWAALAMAETEIEGEEKAAPPPGPTVSAADLALINSHRARIGQAPLDPAAVGWGREDVAAEARRIRSLNPATLRRRLLR